MALWAQVHRNLPVRVFHDEASRRGVLFQPGNLFVWGGRETQHVRLGYGALDEQELTTAVGLLAESAHAVDRRKTAR
jgi:DNA-binding transcriptional MocR family regulator